MALPPEHINIKRRREEEPVDMLYIQSELHQKKRRFTDFVFQRVRISGDEVFNHPNAATSAAAAAAPAQRKLRCPRSASSIFSSFPAAGDGVPVVRTTSPGAEFREERKLAAARREAADKRKRALESTPHQAGIDEPRHLERSSTAESLGGLSPASSRNRDAPATRVNKSPSFSTSLRRFHISRPSTPSALLKATAGGVQKRKDGLPARAVLVEKLTRKPSLRGLSALETLERQSGSSVEVDTRLQSKPASESLEQSTTARKRPVISQAEKRWREQQKSSISAATERLTALYEEPDGLERLTKELEEVVLNWEVKEDDLTDEPPAPPPQTAQKVYPKPRPLKYQPRPQKPRPPVSTQIGSGAAVIDPSTFASETIEDDSDMDYVYDVYIRRPLPAEGNAVKSFDGIDQAGIDAARRDIGVVVITEDDKDIWETYAEDEEDDQNWDDDDVDSNAEDNPANDYPDEELSSADEFDDPTAMYSRYRHGGSDGEEYDITHYDDGDDDDGTKYARHHWAGDSDSDSDSDSDIHVRRNRYDNDDNDEYL